MLTVGLGGHGNYNDCVRGGVWDVRAFARRQPEIFERLSAEPGVEAVAAAWRAPLYGDP